MITKNIFLMPLMGALAAMAAQAGSITEIGYISPLGGGNYGLIGQNNSGGLNGGDVPACAGYITAATTTGGNAANNCGALPAPGATNQSPADTIGGTGGTMAKINYDQYLFQQATENGINPTIPTATSLTPNTLTTSDGATFALMGGNLTALSNGSETGTVNAWFSSNQDGTSEIYVPINVFDVTTAYTMLNDFEGSNVQLTFYFNSTDALSGSTQVSLALTDGLNIRAAVLCGTPGTSTGCPTGVFTTLTAGSAGTNVTATNVTGGQINVSTGSFNVGLYNSICPTTFTTPTTYCSAANAYGYDAGSSGSLTLDDQAYNFGTQFQGDYLVGVQVQELSGSPSVSGFVPGAMNKFALSAVSVSATPEPGTVALSLTGLLLTGLGLRRKQRT